MCGLEGDSPTCDTSRVTREEVERPIVAEERFQPGPQEYGLTIMRTMGVVGTVAVACNALRRYRRHPRPRGRQLRRRRRPLGAAS